MSKSFNAVATIEGNNLLVVDGLNLAFRFKHANKKVFAEEYLGTVMSLAKSYDCSKVIVLGDGGSDYRYGIYPEYKGNRKKLREEQTKEEADDFAEFLKEFDRCLMVCKAKYITIKLKGVEADDIAAFISLNYQHNFDHIWLVSSDKDWDLLINNKVSRFSTHQRKEITIDNWSTHYSYSLEDHISVKVLQGDKGDNIEGVAGIGEKRAISLISEYGSALDIYDILPINDPRKFMQNLNSFGDTIMLNYALMDLPTYCEDAIGSLHLTKLKDILDKELE